MAFIQKHLHFFMALAGGMLYAVGFPLFNGHSFFLAPLIGFILFNEALQRESLLKKQLMVGALYSLGFYLMGFYWIPHTLKEFGGLFFPFNALLGLLFSLVITPQVYAYILIKRFLHSPLLLAATYALLEYLVPQQFPAHLGHSFMSLAPHLHLVLAPLFGAVSYSFFTALMALTFLSAWKKRSLPKLHSAFLLAALSIHVPFFHQAPSMSEPSDLKVRIIQPNIGNFIKLDSERGGSDSLKSVYRDYYTLSTQNTPSTRDLIIWPETAFPDLLFSDVLKSNPHFPPPLLIEKIAKETKAELFIGGYDSTTQPNRNSYQSNYNSAFHFSAEGKLKNVYHKMRLIPFGEGLPFGPLNPYLSNIITNISYFEEGQEFTHFETQKGQSFAAVICYEILFPSFLIDMLNEQKTEAQFLVNLTNDSWYGDTAEPLQHLFLSKWRAVEFNLPIIRSTNTGITTVIYPDGSEAQRLGVGEKSLIDFDLKIYKREKTWFQKFGLLNFIALVVFLVLVELAFKRKAFLQEVVKPNKT